jgi:hypothetical protein
MTCCTRLACAQGEGKTLREALAEQQVPIEVAKLPNLDKKITSGATLTDASQFVIAYFLKDASDAINPPLFVDRYDRKNAEWQTAALGDSAANGQELDAECGGSVLRIISIGKRLFLETHLNPSAGCVLIFSTDLKLQATLFGWVVGQLNDDEIVYEKSQVHFAAVHPTEITLFDLRGKREVAIFPHKPYQAVTLAHIEQLREFYKTHEKWCRENDEPCDPEQFDSALEGDVVANDGEKAVAFVISYEQIQVFEGDQKPSGPEHIVYVYRHADDEAKLEYREMLWEDVRARVGNVPLAKLVEPQMLEKIFAAEPAKREQ